MRKQNWFLVIAVMLAMIMGSGSAFAIVWDGSDDGNWSTGNNWVGGVAPVAGETAEFNAASLANFTTVCDYAIGGGGIPAGITIVMSADTLTPITIQFDSNVTIAGITLTDQTQDLTILAAGAGLLTTTGPITIATTVGAGVFNDSKIHCCYRRYNY